MDQQKIERYVSQIGELGCARIREIIQALQHGDSLPEIRGLDQAESRVVLTELQSIMAVYDLR